MVLGYLTIVNDMGIDDYPSVPIWLIPLSQEVINLLSEFRFSFKELIFSAEKWQVILWIVVFGELYWRGITA